MKSVDKLRELGKHTEPCIWTADDVKSAVMIEKETLDKCLDNIEREAADMRDFCERLDDAATKREDVTLWGVDYTPLPVDADGVPIHVGDVMEERSGHTFEAASLMAFGGSDNWLVLSDARNFSSFREPHDIRHHHAPTVEDVLADMFAEYFDVDGDPHKAAAKVIAEYASKLRLAGDE